ncbi:hypothetical protein RB595_010094 [Gaeumannomyces hyphopodioides]
MSDFQGHRSAGSGLSLNLSSNNPFRNRAVSPTNLPQSPASPFDDPVPPPRPTSRNPFLDPANKPVQPRSQQVLISTDDMDSKTNNRSPTAEEIFDALTLDDGGKKGTPQPASSRPPRPPGARGENVPPPGRRGPPPPNHRPTRSQEEAMRARRMHGSGPSGSSNSPGRRGDRRPRRNSESSVLSADKEKTLTEEEKKARDQRRKERERRHRSRDSKDKTKPPSRKLDIIDQLDATSIYGTGLFHHDGPFDALNPHRNKKGSSRAPMQAFPKDSLNNVLGGSGPVNARPDHATFMGNSNEEAFKEYASPLDKQGSSSRVMPVFDPTSRGSILHGDESLGLGTSTFLEGTPAARTVIQRREAEMAANQEENGLQRKKSLAQRIRGINRDKRRDFEPSGRMTNPDGARRSPTTYGAHTSSSVQSSRSERNPFFNEFGDRGGEDELSVRRPDPRTKSPTSPMPPLERKGTSDSNGAPSPLDDQAPRQGSGGLLARVKSLKGGRRGRPSGGSGEPSPALPGTAA